MSMLLRYAGASDGDNKHCHCNRDGSSAITNGNGSTATAKLIPRRPATETVPDLARFCYKAGETAASARPSESLRAAKRH